MTDTPTPPDGWYPDPAGGGGLRRWNGTSWTDEVRSAAGDQAAPNESVHDASSSNAPVDASGQDAPGREDSHDASSSNASVDASGQDASGGDGSHDDAAASLTASEPVAHPPHEGATLDRAPHAPSDSATSTPAGAGYTAASAGVPPVTPPVAPSAAPAYTSAPAFPSAPSYPAAPAYGAAAAAGADYGAAPGYPSAPPVAYDTAAPRRDIKTNTVWIWLMVFLPVLSLLGVVIFDWSSYFRDAFYAGVYSYDSGPASMAGTNAATTLIAVVSSVVSLVVSALTVLFAFLDWRQLRARGVDRPFHWAFSFFVLAIGSGLVYIIGRGVILRRRTGSGLAPIWASIAVHVAVIIAFIVWIIVLVSQLTTMINEFSSSYGY